MIDRTRFLGKGSHRMAHYVNKEHRRSSLFRPSFYLFAKGRPVEVTENWAIVMQDWNVVVDTWGRIMEDWETVCQDARTVEVSAVNAQDKFLADMGREAELAHDRTLWTGEPA